MKRKRVSYRWKHIHPHEQPIRWLPIDSRFFTPFIKFGRVSGLSRVFLELEITLSLLIVGGTLVWAGLRIVSMMVK